jgi:AsmA family protein
VRLRDQRAVEASAAAAPAGRGLQREAPLGRGPEGIEALPEQTMAFRVSHPMAARSHPVLKGFGIALGVLVVLIVAIFLAWDWNWFKPLVERTASSAMGRPVTIERLNASLLHMTLEADGIAIGNPEGFAEGSRFGSIDRIMLTIDPRSIFRDQFHIPALIIDHPVGDLGRDKAGKANWEFGSSKPKQENAVEKSKPPPLLGSVIINDGHVHIVDPKLKSDFRIDINTDQPKGGGEPQIVLDAKGTYVGEPINIHFRGGSLLSLRDAGKPYPIDLKADHGPTRVSVQGSVQDPSSFGGANVRVHLEGQDLSDLSNLIAVPLAPTPPYSLDGKLDYAKGRIHFDDFAGKVGDSDLSGNFRVDPGKDRPMVAVDMTSNNVDLKDLGGFIGADTHNEKPQKSTLLPDNPINLDAIRNNDFDVKYRAKQIKGQSIPLDNLQAHLVIKDGVVKLDPLDFGVGVGKIASTVDLNARQNPPAMKAQVDLRQVDLRRIMQSTKVFQGAGLIGGHAVLEGHGVSLAQMLGTSNGDIKFFMSDGDMSALLVDLAGLDFGNSLLSALGLPQKAALRCMVSDFGVKDGVMNTRLFLIDTTEANVIGSGTVNLRDERIDYRIETAPKRASIGSAAAPINVTGPFKSPSIRPDAAALGARGAAAAVLGTLLTPLGALIPTIQLGLGKDNDCGALVQAVRSTGGAPTGVGESGSRSNGSATGDPKNEAPER